MPFIKLKGGILRETAVTIASILSTAGTAVTTAVSTAWGIISGNPVMSFWLGVSVVGAGFGFIKRGIRVSRK